MTAPFFTVSYDYIGRARGPFPGRRITGSYELDFDRNTRACIVQDIRTGQYEDVDRVYLSTPGESCDDITEDVAREIYNALAAEMEPCPKHLRNWIDENVGVNSADYLDRHEAAR